VQVEQRFVEVFRIAALQAGAVAMRLRGRVAHERKGGHGTLEGSAVSAADLATQDVILYALHAYLPGVAVDAEEDTDTRRLFPPEGPGRPLVVVDPIDGSLNYLRGSDDFAVMGSLVREGRFTASLIYFPVHGTTVWAVRGEGCWREDAGGERRRIGVAGAPDVVMVTPRSPRRWRTRLTDVAPEVVVSRCSAVDSSAPALGRARGAISEGLPDRRRAIGYLLTTEAGGVVTLGGTRWRGEDPARLPRDAAPAVTADGERTAASILQAVSR
jgi:fructose-1,6-bisphosphatase/inositol monophosphatase family enzyme